MISDTEWDASSDARQTCVNMDMDEDATEVYQLLTEYEYPPPHVAPATPVRRRDPAAAQSTEMVLDWRVDVPMAIPTPVIRPPSPTSSDWSTSSSVTVQDFSDRKMYGGEWLSGSTEAVRDDIDS